MSDAQEPMQPESPEQPSQLERAKAKLSPSCRVVFDRACEEAAQDGSTYVSAHHLLIALASETDSAAGRLLASLGCSADEIRVRIGFVQGAGAQQHAASCPLPYSPRIERLLLIAEKDGAKRGAAEIGTLHLLASLLTERSGMAVFVLEEPGFGLERIGTALQAAFRDKWEDGGVGS